MPDSPARGRQIKSVEQPWDGADLPTAAQMLFDAAGQRAMVNDTSEAEARALRLAVVAIARERRPGLHLFEDWPQR